MSIIPGIPIINDVGKASFLPLQALEQVPPSTMWRALTFDPLLTPLSGSL